VTAPESVTVEGRWAVEALLDSPFFATESVFVEEGRHRELRERAEALGFAVRPLSRDAMAGEAGFAFHRGVFARARRPALGAPDDEFLAGARRLLVPLGIADGGNLGTLIRTAAAFGVGGIVVEAGRATDPFSRKCIRASATAIFRVPVFEVRCATSMLARMDRAGIVPFAATAAEGATPLARVEPVARAALVLGAEKDGLPPAVEAACRERVAIPMGGGVESLNVAASGAILLWELFGRGEGGVQQG